MTKVDPKGRGERFQICFDKIIDFRYAIAAVIFAILVLCKVNYSSINIWRYVVAPSSKSTVIAGVARDLRSDEWEVLTPFYMAQSDSATPYSVSNPNVSTSGHNMILSLGAPVRDVYILSKPLDWGFLLFGNTYGLSWYWNLKILMMILLSFEMCMILTKGNRAVSLLGAFWIAFSPAVQWWFAQHVGDIVLYMQAIAVSFYYFLRFHDQVLKKTAFAAAFSLSCLGYVFPLYPALQVPLGYLCILFMILFAFDFRSKIRLSKLDLVIMSCSAILILLVLAHVFLVSKDAVHSFLNTVYPGKRISSGGRADSFAFYGYLTNLFIPFKSFRIAGLNECEVSSFYNFLPAVLLTLPVLVKKKARNLKYGISLAVFSVLCVGYMYCKIPVLLAKATLLSYVTDRITIVYGLSAVYLSVWALNEIARQKGLSRVYAWAVSGAVTLSCLLTIRLTVLKNYIGWEFYLMILVLVLLLNVALLRGRMKAFAILMSAVIFVSGMTVNPINIGTGALFDNQLSAEVRSIGKKDPGAVWTALDSDRLCVFLYANGVHTLGGINNFPDLNLWRKLDPSGAYESIYNRSAHIKFCLTDAKTYFTKFMDDFFIVHINIHDLKKLNVDYLVTDQKMEQYDTASERFVQVAPRDGFQETVYQVLYH